MSPDSSNKVAVVAAQDNTIADANLSATIAAAETTAPELTEEQKAKLIAYMQASARRRHANRHNTPFDGAIRSRKRAKVKASRKANLRRRNRK